MSHAIYGTCSLCHGPVGVPSVWFGVIPPTPKCLRCGAEPAAPFGKIIPMQKRCSCNPQSTGGNLSCPIHGLGKCVCNDLTGGKLVCPQHGLGAQT